MRVLLFLLLAAVPALPGVDKATLKKMEAFGTKWWKARPKSKFQEWNSNKRVVCPGAMLRPKNTTAILPAHGTYACIAGD